MSDKKSNVVIFKPKKKPPAIVEHYCSVEKGKISIEVGNKCNWCGSEEKGFKK